MARNLSRNTQLFVSTIAPADFNNSGGCLPADTWEIKVLDGYSFSQDVTSQEIGISESAAECGSGGLARGTLGFNTALNPVDVSFSTYVRPFDTGALGDAVEKALWGAALGAEAEFTASPDVPADAIWETTATDLEYVFTHSDVNELQLLYLYFVLDNTTYVISNFTVGTAEVDFSIDGIATINWSGSGTSVVEWPTINAIVDHVDWVADTDYQAVPTTTASSFIRNKLSSIVLTDNKDYGTPDDADTFGSVAGAVITLGTATITDLVYAGGRVYNADADEWASIVSNNTTTVTVAPSDEALVNVAANWNATDVLDFFLSTQHSAVDYCIPITGGTLTLENNMSYLTPEELAIVNQPLAGFTGNRIVSGSFTAYLNTGAMGTGGLLDDLLSKITEVNNDFALTFKMGGAAAIPRVEFVIPHAQIGIPTMNVEDVLTTEISFNAQPWTGDSATGAASFEGANDMVITYISST